MIVQVPVPSPIPPLAVDQDQYSWIMLDVLEVKAD